MYPIICLTVYHITMYHVNGGGSRRYIVVHSGTTNYLMKLIVKKLSVYKQLLGDETALVSSDDVEHWCC